MKNKTGIKLIVYSGDEKFSYNIEELSEEARARSLEAYNRRDMIVLINRLCSFINKNKE